MRHWISIFAILTGLATVVMSADQSRPRFRLAAGCTFQLGPTSRTSPAEGEASVPVVVDTQPGCEWTAESQVAWITISSGFSGAGDGSVVVDVAANIGVPRSGTVTIAGLTFTVNQDEADEEAPVGPLVGVYRFDAWDPAQPVDVNPVTMDLLQNNTNYRYRLPYHAVLDSPTTAMVNENTQENIDQDILYAHNAGIDFWVVQPTCSWARYAIEKLATSQYRSLMKFASAQSSVNNPCRVAGLLIDIQDPQYLTVLDGRPVIFIFSDFYFFGGGGSTASITSLRADVVATVGKNPYIVGMDVNATNATASMAHGLDAISSYGMVGQLIGAGVIPYSTLAASEESEWVSFKNTGFQTHPVTTTGWQDFSTYPGTPSFQTGEATPSEIANHLTNMLAFTAAYPSSNVANFVMISAWNEYTENHYLAPYNTDTNAVGTGRIDAIAAVLGGAACTYSIAPTSESSPAAGETNIDSVVDTQPGCAWTAVSNVGWITVTSGSSGAGDGTVLMDAAANVGAFRSGTVTIAGHTFTVNQSGVSSGSIISEGDVDWDCPVGCGLATLPGGLSNGAAVPSHQTGQGAFSGYVGNIGLTYRTITGTSYFITTADARFVGGVQGEPFLFHCDFSGGTCAVDDNYHDVYDGKRVDINETTGFGDGNQYSGPTGIHWDAVTSQLWWTYPAAPYSDGTPPDRSLGRSSLASGSGTGIAAYSFSPIPYARLNGPIIPIPAAHQASFGGKHYFLCNNGYHSGNISDPALYCIALDLPTSGDGANVTDYTIISGHDWPVVAAQMDPRPAWVGPLIWGWNAGADQSDWFDFHLGCIFPDNGTHYGLMCFSNWNLGGVNYINADTAGHGNKTGIDVWDPADLAAVYAGSAPIYSPKPVPSSQWEVQWPGWDYTKFPFVLQEKTVTSASASASTEFFTFNFAGGHGGKQPGDKFTYFGLPGYAGFTIISVPNSTTVIACTAQDPDNTGNCFVDAVTSNLSTSTPATAWTYAIRKQYGQIMGAVWMPTNSACGGEDNMIAVMYDVYDIANDHGDLDQNSVRRVVRCGKLN